MNLNSHQPGVTVTVIVALRTCVCLFLWFWLFWMCLLWHLYRSAHLMVEGSSVQIVSHWPSVRRQPQDFWIEDNVWQEDMNHVHQTVRSPYLVLCMLDETRNHREPNMIIMKYECNEWKNRYKNTLLMQTKNCKNPTKLA